jgi:hypothetical protein
MVLRTAGEGTGAKGGNAAIAMNNRENVIGNTNFKKE